MKQKQLKHGVLLVDDDVYDSIISKFACWSVYNTRAKKGYVQLIFDNKRTYLHRAILTKDGRDLTRQDIVDHINRNPLDNRRENLRVVGYCTNNHNKTIGSNNTSGYKGVYFHNQHNKWIGYYHHDKKRFWTKPCLTALEAALERDKAVYELYKDLTFLNLPELYEE
jgi:hypothetical protein